MRAAHAAFQEKFNLGRSRCYELKCAAVMAEAIPDFWFCDNVILAVVTV